MSKLANKLLKISAFFLLFVLTDHFTEKATWGFTTARLHTTHDLGFSNRGDPTSYLHQKFYLFAQGGQSYTFVSQDGTTVLKLFKDMPRPWLALASYQQKKLGKLRRTLKGYALAFDRLQKLTGLIALHLKTTPSSPLPVTLVDRLNISHTVDLSSIYFILQHRAQPLSSHPFSLSQVQKLIEERCAAHLADHDPRLHLNLGWKDQELIFIDPGRFVHNPRPSPDLPEKFLKYAH